jgi:hypothetical protein
MADRRGGALGQMIGIVGGGFLGLALGYYILVFVGGPQYNFLKLNLPGLAKKDAPALLNEEDSDSRDTSDATPTEGDELLMPVPQSGTFEDDASRAATSREDETDPTQADAPQGLYVRGAEVFLADDLHVALDEANAAAGCEHCGSLGFIQQGDSPRSGDKPPPSDAGTGPLPGKQASPGRHWVVCPHCGGKPTGKINADSFARLCHLAQVVTFMDREDPQLRHWRDAVRSVLFRAGSNQDKLNALGRMSGYLLEGNQRTGDGVLLAGTVQSVEFDGRHHIWKVVLFGQPNVVTVVGVRGAAIQQRDRVLIVGSIVDDAPSRLIDYQGQEPTVVFRGYATVIPEAR